MDKFRDFLENKKVIIIGPSPKLLEKEDGVFFDSFDVVCRIKKSFPVPPDIEKNIGKRTDILITHLKMRSRLQDYDQNNFKKHKAAIFNKNLKFIYFPLPRFEHFNRFYRVFTKSCCDIKVPLIHQETNDNLLKLRKELNNYDPTTGIAGILGLLDYNIKELYITGMDFQKDGFVSYYKSSKEDKLCKERTKEVHNMNYELEFFKKLLKENSKIKIDDNLKKLI